MSNFYTSEGIVDPVDRSKPHRKFSVLSIIALVVGIFFPIGGLVLGIIALVRVLTKQQSGLWVAIAAIIVSAASWAISAAIAVQSLL